MMTILLIITAVFAIAATYENLFENKKNNHDD